MQKLPNLWFKISVLINYFSVTVILLRNINTTYIKLIILYSCIVLYYVIFPLIQRVCYVFCVLRQLITVHKTNKYCYANVCTFICMDTWVFGTRIADFVMCTISVFCSICFNLYLIYLNFLFDDVIVKILIFSKHTKKFSIAINIYWKL